MEALSVTSSPSSSSSSSSSPAAAPRWSSDAERLKSFGAALDRIRDDVESRIGDEDVRWIRSVDRFSRTMEVVGRALLHVSFEPVGFTLGVVALWLHKQLQATEVGHTALHGAFDRFPEATRYHSKTFRWQAPMDEESWRRQHNVAHHQYTNIMGKDPDVHFGTVRLTDQVPYKSYHRWQVPLAFLTTFPIFGAAMNLHVTGVLDVWQGSGDVLADRSKESIRAAYKRALRKFVPYYAKEYVLFPLLAGPGFLKVAFGNAITELMRDVYSACTIYCGHVGEDVASYPEGHKARGRGEWYAMQVQSANNYEVPLPISILCGALDRQIEHHLFPKMPTNRLREISPAVKKACEEHGIPYRTGSWWSMLKQALRQVARLSKKPNGIAEVLKEAA